MEGGTDRWKDRWTDRLDGQRDGRRKESKALAGGIRRKRRASGSEYSQTHVTLEINYLNETHHYVQ